MKYGMGRHIREELRGGVRSCGGHSHDTYSSSSDDKYILKGVTHESGMNTHTRTHARTHTHTHTHTHIQEHT